MNTEEKLEYLRNGIRKYLDGDAGFPVETFYTNPTSPSKHDKCKHGRYRWEGCEACTDDYLEELLRESA